MTGEKHAANIRDHFNAASENTIEVYVRIAEPGTVLGEAVPMQGSEETAFLVKLDKMKKRPLWNFY